MLYKIFAIGLFSFFMASASFSMSLNLYEQPKPDAKIVGTVDPAIGIVPIFTPKEGGWIKVGNPKNGDVGWIKSSELEKAGTTSSGFSFSQKMVDTGKGSQSSILQFGIPSPLTKEQSDALYKKIQAQQAAIQQNFQQIMQDLFTTYSNAPIIMPIVIVPAQPKATPSTNTAPVNPKK